MSRSVALGNLRVLAVTGADRVAFLQGQLTQDVAQVRTGASLFAGWADPRGRLLFAGHLCSLALAGEAALALLVPDSLAGLLLNRLRMYVVRAKVQVNIPELCVTGVFSDRSDPPGATDPGSVSLLGDDSRRFAFAAPARSPPAIAEPGLQDEWELEDIRAGIPTILPATTGEFVPQMVNLDLLGGISFTKGCYTGQEIVARLKYLGRVKRRMLRFSSPDARPGPGAPLFGARGAVGQVVRSAPAGAGSEFLAVLVLDDLPGPFFLDPALERAVRRLELPYPVAD